jgi:hypothetical protein
MFRITRKFIIKTDLHKNRLYPTEELYRVFDVPIIQQRYVECFLCYTQKKPCSNSLTNYLHDTRITIRHEFVIPRATKRMQIQSAHYIAHILCRKMPAQLLNTQLGLHTYKLMTKTWKTTENRYTIEKLITSMCKE